MIIAIRIVGVYLVLTALANLFSLFIIDLDSLVSPTATAIRYTFLAIAGVGFLAARKWGFLVYFASFTINWITYFTIYEGQGSVGPLWLTIPIPLAICALTYFAWEKLA